MSSAVQPLPLSPEEDARLRAQRVAAMLDRWGKEDVADEPDWEISQIEPLRLDRTPNRKRSASEKE